MDIPVFPVGLPPPGDLQWFQSAQPADEDSVLAEQERIHKSWLKRFEQKYSDMIPIGKTASEMGDDDEDDDEEAEDDDDDDDDDDDEDDDDESDDGASPHGHDVDDDDIIVDLDGYVAPTSASTVEPVAGPTVSTPPQQASSTVVVTDNQGDTGTIEMSIDDEETMIDGQSS